MSITLELPQDLEIELLAKASRLGMNLSDYIVQILSSSVYIDRMPKTGPELVKYWKAESLIGTRSDITDSQVHARQIREQAERRQRI
ncbi:MAG: hypothetical protein WEB58_20700 [Planctomycetaceae bacterium]